MALIVAGIGMITGALALSRSAARNARDLAIAALVLGMIGMVLGRLARARATAPTTTKETRSHG